MPTLRDPPSHHYRISREHVKITINYLISTRIWRVDFQLVFLPMLEPNKKTLKASVGRIRDAGDKNNGRVSKRAFRIKFLRIMARIGLKVYAAKF